MTVSSSGKGIGGTQDDKLFWLFQSTYLSQAWRRIFLTGLLISFPVFLILHIGDIYRDKQLYDELAAEMYERVRQIDFQLKVSLRQTQATDYEFCSEPDMAVMRQQLDLYHYLGDMGRIQNGKIVCTVKKGELSPPLPLTGPISTSESGITHWNNQNKLFIAKDDYPIMTVGSSAVTLSPAFLADLGTIKFGPIDSGGYLYLKDSEYLFKIFGKLELEHVQDVRNSDTSLIDWFPLKGSMVRTRFCEPTVNICLMTVVSGYGIFNNPPFLLLLAIIGSIILGVVLAFVIIALRGGPNAVLRKLRKAITHKKIYPEYQPKVNLESGEITGVEALARWHDPLLGAISPDVFISVAEQNHLIAELTEQFIKRVFDDLHDLLESRDNFKVSINVSPDNIASTRFQAFLDDQVARHQFQTHQVILEITERTTSNSDAMARASEKLKAHGYRMSLDDFGTGFSNLSWLTTFEPNEIKIDKMFTQSIDTETVNSITLNGMFSMIDHLDVDVVFEGIETEEQLDFIRQRVPKATGQGWLFYKSMPLKELYDCLG